MMKRIDVTRQAFVMPFSNQSYPREPYRFVDREFFIIKYRADVDALRAVIPEPLAFTLPLAHYELIRMPDPTGFDDYTDSGQGGPVTLNDQAGGYVDAMYLNDDAPIAGGREIWEFPKKNSPNRRCQWKRIYCLARSITGRWVSRPARWDTNTLHLSLT